MLQLLSFVFVSFFVFLSPKVAADESAGANEGIVEEIIVTATYRETNLMETPLSISAISDSFVEDLGAQSMEDVYTMVPALSMTGGRNGEAQYSIRGVSSQSGGIGYAPAGATIGIYVDGTPVTAALGPNNQISGALFDIDRVEVLKGPQGTLFGEGSQGGTIRMIYNQPDSTGFDMAFNANMAKMAEADDMSNRFDGMVNIPLGESMALRVTGWKSETAGYIDNEVPDEPDFNDALSSGVRAALRFDGDSYNITGSIYHSEQETKGGVATYAAYKSNYNRLTGLPPRSEDTLDIYSLSMEFDFGWATLQTQTSYQDREITGLYEATADNAALLDIYYLGGTEADLAGSGCAAIAAFAIDCATWPGFFGAAGVPTTADGKNIQAISSVLDNWTERWSQEIRLISPADQQVRWTLGAFWKDSKDHTGNTQTAGYFPGRAYAAALMDPLLDVPANVHTDYIEETAIFGEVSYDLPMILNSQPV
jgi:outer membrane receptor protein involved in Fe transport